jgi:hypothetical protein
MKTRTVEHVMGPLLESMIQECARCGEVLTDYRNTWVPSGTPPIRGLTPGQRFVKSDHPSGAGFAASRELVGQIAAACDPILEHVAGKPENGRQSCARCQAPLLAAPSAPEPGMWWAPEGDAVVATATVLMPRGRWQGETRSCRTSAPEGA